MRPTLQDGSNDAADATDARGRTVAVVTSRYHEDVTGPLLDGARAAFARAGGDPGRLLVLDAPGAFELVPIAAVLAEREDVDAVVCLGCIVRGETRHDRHLAGAIATGLAEIAAACMKPVSFGVLTVENVEQARARAGGDKGNKGEEAMLAALGATAAIDRARDLAASPSTTAGAAP